jgi:hypothetical protein
MRAPISRRYQQAIAKIAFHFFLQYFPRYSGFEPEFEPIKAFIYSGAGNADQFVRPTNEPFVLELQRGGRVKQWLHLLSAETDGQRVVSRLQFLLALGSSPSFGTSNSDATPPALSTRTRRPTHISIMIGH